MAGGPSTPGLALAATAAGALAVLPAGYLSPEALTDGLAAVRHGTDEAFGVNLFLPGRPADPAVVAAFVAELGPEAEIQGVGPGPARFDDDQWEAKLAVLLARPPALVSFTFGCPSTEVVGALRAAGCTVAVTVTRPDEARAAAGAGADALVVQGREAGAHQGTFRNDGGPPPSLGLLDLLGRVGAVTDLPLVAAGGVMNGAGTAAARAAGAVAVQCGTAFLRCPEAGTHPVHRAALARPGAVTDFTRAFSGRWARGVRNRFMDAHRDAPAAYPELHNATRPLRAAAAARGDAGGMSLWAGTGLARAEARPAGEVVERLTAGDA
jgi:nitronate monooxygenase